MHAITEALYKDDSLQDRQILSFSRYELASTAILPKLFDLLGKQSNQNGAIGDAVAEYQKGRERAATIDSELKALVADRDRIDGRIRELETERTALLGFSDERRDKPKAASTPSNVYKHPASKHILDLLREREAFSLPRGVERKSLDEQLINKAEGVHGREAVSHGIIELRRDKGAIDHEGGKNSSRPIGKVWLLGTHDKPAV